jgi:hypothetical protein
MLVAHRALDSSGNFTHILYTTSVKEVRARAGDNLIFVSEVITAAVAH